MYFSQLSIHLEVYASLGCEKYVLFFTYLHILPHLFTSTAALCLRAVCLFFFIFIEKYFPHKQYMQHMDLLKFDLIEFDTKH